MHQANRDAPPKRSPRRKAPTARVSVTKPDIGDNRQDWIMKKMINFSGFSDGTYFAVSGAYASIEFRHPFAIMGRIIDESLLYVQTKVKVL